MGWSQGGVPTHATDHGRPHGVFGCTLFVVSVLSDRIDPGCLSLWPWCGFFGDCLRGVGTVFLLCAEVHWRSTRSSRR